MESMGEQRNIFVREGVNPFTGEKTYFTDVSALSPPSSAAATPRCRITIDSTEAAESHFFGVPRLDGDWPIGANGPLDCLLNIKCSDLPTQSSGLPNDGWLTVFYDLEESDWGGSSDSHRHWHLKWSSEDAKEATVPSDLNLNAAVPVVFDVEGTASGDGPEHSIWGTADWIQGDERPMVHFRSGYFLRHAPTVAALQEAGVAPESLRTDDRNQFQEAILKLDRSSVAPERFHEGVQQWQLLLQIDTDDDLDLMWGDVGKLYVLIPSESLRDRRFGDSWIVLQCH